MSEKTIAFLPLRGGSKSILKKNIKLINDKPLFSYVLESALNSELISKVIVSTDCEEIKQSVQNFISKNNLYEEKTIIFKRNPITATDNATTESAMLDFAENSSLDWNKIILIQATSPLLETQFLNQAIIKLQNENLDSILSVVRQKRFIWKQENETFSPQNYNYQNRPMRQNFDGYLVENGCFYLTSKSALIKSKLRISGKIGFIEMPEETYFELDEPTDFIIIEQLLKLRNKNSKNKLSQIIKNIKAVFTDCDGVLTDSGMYISEKGDELKKFSARDGMAFELLKKNGFLTGIITGENSQAVKRRAEKLKTDEIHIGIKDKLSILNSICEKRNLKPEEIAYIGDDINDLPILKVVGLPMTVNDGVTACKKSAIYISEKKGGHNAFREIVDFILEL